MAEGSLKDTVSLVTGSSKGIGAATAHALASAGAHVVLTGRDVKALETVEDAVHEAGGSATIAPIDLTEPDAIARLAQAVGARWDKLDHLIINAAYLPELTPVTQIDPAEFNKALMTNVIATQTLLARFDPLLKRAGAGRIVGLTSSVGGAPRAYWGAYGSTKAAFDTLLDCYAQEVEKVSEVKVAVLDPGATRTKMRERAYPGEDPQTVKPPEVVATEIRRLLIEGFENRWRGRVHAD